MKISIITPSYNSEKTIARTIESVIAQNYSNLEYIIIDGLSTDKTKDIVMSYKNRLNIMFISEKDTGIYDAMNKGIKIATGEIIGILNSDDYYISSDIFSTVSESFENDSTDAVYGDISYFSNDENKTIRYWKSGTYEENKLNKGWIIPHPSLFLKKSVYAECGFFNTDFKIAGDYEFILRILKIYKIRVKYIPKAFTRMYNGGFSGLSLKQRIKGWKEIKKAWIVNNFKIPLLLILRRLFFKFDQYMYLK